MKQIAHCLYREDEFHVAQCLNVDVSSFGPTREEAVANLKEAVELYFEGETAPPFTSLARRSPFPSVGCRAERALRAAYGRLSALCSGSVNRPSQRLPGADVARSRPNHRPGGFCAVKTDFSPRRQRRKRRLAGESL